MEEPEKLFKTLKYALCEIFLFSPYLAAFFLDKIVA